MVAKDLSIIIPAREEIFLQRTISNILENIEADTEIIAICDGYWPNPPVEDHPRVVVVHHTESIGQRAATNEGARISQAKFIMKADAHCAFDKGFDRKLMANCEYNWTVIPEMWNLHGFDWMCKKCGNRTYQKTNPPDLCDKCKESKEFEMVIVWKPRDRRRTSCWRFDKDMHFQYWSTGQNRPEFAPGLLETMSFVGNCFFIHRNRFWELDGLDENHGSWGQFGTELACKTWLSGGKLITNRNTWFGHMFRTNSQFTFPYKLSNSQVYHAQRYSRDLWLNNKWPKQKYPLKWLVDKFWPVDGWTEEDRSRLPVLIPAPHIGRRERRLQQMGVAT